MGGLEPRRLRLHPVFRHSSQHGHTHLQGSVCLASVARSSPDLSAQRLSVKSVDLDIWQPDQMEQIQKWGNKLGNLYWEAHLKPGHVPPEQFVLRGI